MILFAQPGGAYASKDGSCVIYPLDDRWTGYVYLPRRPPQLAGEGSDVMAVAKSCMALLAVLRGESEKIA